MTWSADPRILNRSLWAAAASWLVLVMITLTTSQGLHFFDPVLPLRALLQWQDGPSSHWNILQRVDPADLARDRSEWLGWWAPGTSLLMLPGTLAGIKAGHLLRLIAAVAILVGSLGWIRWFARFSLPPLWLVALAVSLPWMRYSSANLFRYSAEVLAFGVAPWAFLALSKIPSLVSDRRIIPVALTGLLLGFTYWLKFSLLVSILAGVAALGAWWLWSSRRHRSPPPTARATAVFLVCLAVAPLAWQLTGRLEGGATPLGGPRGLAWSPIDLVFVLANPALAAADAFGPLFFALVHPGLPVLGGKTLAAVAWAGAPAGVLLFALLASALLRREVSAHVAIGAASVLFATLALAALRIVGDVDQTPRHLAPVSLAALPVALSEARRWWETRRSRTLRAVLAASGLCYVAGPLIFGFAYVAAKAFSNTTYAESPQAISLLSLPADDALVAHLDALYRVDPKGILVVPDPELTLLWPGRALWQFAGANIGEDLQHSYHGVPADVRWTTRTPVSVHLLVRNGDSLPPSLEKAGFVPSATPWRGRDYFVLSGNLPPSVTAP